MSSKRVYHIIGFEAGQSLEVRLHLNDLIDDNPLDYEYIYKLQEEIDSILDLKVKESMFVSLSRDNVADRGVILRIS